VAAGHRVNTRASLDRELDRLAAMLSPWLARLRHPAQFWPQFNALAGRIDDGAGMADRAHVARRLDAMLAAHGMDRRDDPASGVAGAAAPPSRHAVGVTGKRRAGRARGASG
jgi:hypothetical protein